jgi:tyrosyl-tRNA synthetase
MQNVLDILLERGFIEKTTDETALREALSLPITCYIGFDPTANSLHVGNLVPVMSLVHMQLNGHRPIVIVGGGTGMVGDPSGRSEMRKIMTKEQIQDNLTALRSQFARFLDFDDDRALMLNNADWLTELNYVEFLRDYGVHFTVNRMLAAESYRVRYESERGLNLIEFNYMLLQSYDYLHLHREYGCVLQMGGSDQWGNILAGADLIRRTEGATVHAVTSPLVTTASGAKMGKTAAGAVWIDPERVSPYEYYQYWVNTDDRDVERFMGLFTLLPMEEVRRLGKLEGSDIREAKRILALETTKLAHGEEAARGAQQASDQLFGASRGEADSVPTTVLERRELREGIAAAELFNRIGLCASRGEARRLIGQGGAYVNDRRLDSVEATIGDDDVLDGVVMLRAGKKRYHRVTVE